MSVHISISSTPFLTRFCLFYIEIFDFFTALLYDESYKYFVEQFKYFLVLGVAVRQKIYLVPELQHLVV